MIKPQGKNKKRFTVDHNLAKKFLIGIPGWTSDGKTAVISKNLFPFFPQATIPRSCADHFLENTDFDQHTSGHYKLRPYQHVGRKFLSSNDGCLLADAPRLGKTSQTVSSHEINNGKLIVVAPRNTRAVWLQWFKRRWPTNARIAALKGRTADMALLKNADVAFINYDILTYWMTVNYPIHTVVFDECHLLSNSKTKRYKAASLFAGQAKRVIGLSGTPMWNKPANLHAVLNIINPGEWDNFWAFARRYASGRNGDFGFEVGNPSNEDELKLRLSTMMLRREWQDVRESLPGVTRSVEVVELSVADKIRIDKDLGLAQQDFVKIGDVPNLRMALTLNEKFDLAFNTAQEHLNNDEAVVLWTWHKSVATAFYTKAMEEGYSVEIITGETTSKNFDKALDNWRLTKNGLLVITLGAGQVGIDLSHARHAVFAEIDYTPAVVSQAEMRTYSPERPGTVTYVVTDHPIELAIVRALIRKSIAAAKTGVPASDTPLDFLEETFSLTTFDDLPELDDLFLNENEELDSDQEYEDAEDY